MQQLAVKRPYVVKHLQELHERIQDETLIMKQHMLHFTSWLKDLNIPIGAFLCEYNNNKRRCNKDIF
jgi:hypothetical protein